MHLQKLIISGFKSFAEKVEVNFDEGVTGIVGPNGCGKSNVSDAIRWVLGEQSPRRLRGQQMTDMIFNGTVSRSASGLAEVTLVFDNADGMLPISYREVAVTRRLFRSGESDYLMNNTKCRLKDITDLFLDSGIGTNAYSLMEQGRVDMIVNAKPKDRRQILEETAGVSRFLHRKMEAVRKLDRTDTDLVRLTDILGELQRQKRSLERQARQAELARKYRIELLQSEYTLHIRAGKHLSTQLEEMENRLKALGARIHAKEGELNEVRQRKRALQERLQEQDELNRKHRDRYASSSARLEQLERRVQDLKERGEEYTQLQTRLLHECEADAKRADDEEARIQETQAQVAEAAKTIQAIEEDIERLQGELKGVSEDYATVEKEGQERRKAFLNLEQEITELNNQQRVWQRDKEYFEQRLSQVNNEHKEIQTEVNALESKRDEINQNGESLEARRVELQERFEEKRVQADQLAQEETDSRNQLRECERNWQRAHSRCESLQQLQAKLAGYDEGVRFILQGEGQEKLLGALAERMNVEDGYNRAVEAALSHKLQAIITETDADAAQSIARLRDKKKGRAAFLSKQALSEPLPALSLNGALASLKNAASVVTCPDDWRPVVDRLLSRVLLVDSLEQALELRSQLPDGVRLASKDGDLVERDGSLTGGFTAGSQILQRTAEINQLEKEVKSLGQQRSELEAKAQRLHQAIETSRSERDEAKQQLHDLKNQLRVATEELQRIEQRLQRLEQSDKALTSERERIEQGVNEGAAQSEERAKRLEERQGRKDELELELSRWTEQQQHAQTRLKTLQDGISEKRMTLLEMRKDRERWLADVETFTRHLSELKRGVEEKKHLAAQQDERQKETAAAIEETQKAIVQQRLDQSNVWKEVSESDEISQGIRTEVKAIEQEESNHQEQYETLRSEREEQSQTRMKMQVERDYWRKRLDQEFSTLDNKDECERDERDDEALTEKVEFYRRRLSQLGVVNELAIEEYEDVRDRCDFLESQKHDLEKSKADLLATAKELHGASVDQFLETFEQVKINFNRTFRRMFNGGRAELVLQEGDPMEAGVDIEVQPPGKKLQTLSLLSGGEKALVATALLFAIYEIRPSPFCFLDEIDAPLDDTNVGRFTSMLRGFLDHSQFIMITHNKKSMEICDAIYGVTMAEEGVTSIYSMKFQKANVQTMPNAGELPSVSTTETPEKAAV